MLSVQSLVRGVSTNRRARGRVGRAAGDPRLREAISALPDPERLALALRCYEALSVTTIAGILDLDPEATRKLLEAAAAAVTERLQRPAAAQPRARRGANA